MQEPRFPIYHSRTVLFRSSFASSLTSRPLSHFTLLVEYEPGPCIDRGSNNCGPPGRDASAALVGLIFLFRRNSEMVGRCADPASHTGRRLILAPQYFLWRTSRTLIPIRNSNVDRRHDAASGVTDGFNAPILFVTKKNYIQRVAQTTEPYVNFHIFIFGDGTSGKAYDGATCHLAQIF